MRHYWHKDGDVQSLTANIRLDCKFAIRHGMLRQCDPFDTP
jgi:hypothetical protein